MIPFLIACQGPSAEPTVVPSAPETAPTRAWTFLVWLDGDNNLESYVLHDLDELERAARGPVTIVAQVDRIPGYLDEQGAWDGTRRYEIVPDDQRGPISPVIEDLGEADMGDPAALSDFLLWAHERYPAEHYALVFWNHGGGFWIASDDTSGTEIGVTDGELEGALEPLVAKRGPIDVVAFDACNMGQWEVAEALRGEARTMVASEAWVNGGGYAYDAALTALQPGDGPEVMADLLAWSAGEVNGELTHAAIDLEEIEAFSIALDTLARATSVDTFVEGRALAHGLDVTWEEFWLDAGSFADRVADLEDPAAAAAATDLRAALDGAVISTYNHPDLGFATGLTVFSDTEHGAWIDRYTNGPWAWTQWDEMLSEAHAAGL